VIDVAFRWFDTNADEDVISISKLMFKAQKAVKMKLEPIVRRRIRNTKTEKLLADALKAMKGVRESGRRQRLMFLWAVVTEELHNKLVNARPVQLRTKL